MPETITGLHIGNESLAAITLRRGKKGWVPSAGAMQLLGTADRESPSAALKATTRAAQYNGGPLSLCLPKLHAIVRKALLPSQDAAELAQMARFEAERTIPLHPERHSTSYHILRSMGVEGSEVLLGALDQPVVDRTLAACSGAGVIPSSLTLSSVALVNTLLHMRREWVAGKTIAIVGLGLDVIDIVFMTDGRVLMARSAAVDLRRVLETWVAGGGGNTPAGAAVPSAARPDAARLAIAARMIDCLALRTHTTEVSLTTTANPGNPTGELTLSGAELTSSALGTVPPAAPGEAPLGAVRGSKAGAGDPAQLVEAWIDRILQELRRSYDFARREVRCPPVDALVLTGEGASLRNLDQCLLTSLDAEFFMMNPLDGPSEGPALKLPFGGFELALPFGAAIASELPGAYKLDLIPPGFHRTQSRRRFVSHLVITAVLLIVTLGLSAASYLHFSDMRQHEMDDYTQVLSKMKPMVGELIEMQTKLKIVQQFVDDPNAALPVLNTVVSPKEIPGLVALTTAEYVKGQGVNITGEAREITGINSYITDLLATKKFSDVRPSDQQTRNQFGQQWYTFKIEAPLSRQAPAAKGKGMP